MPTLPTGNEIRRPLVRNVIRLLQTLMNQTKSQEDAWEAWLLRAGAELWKAVVAEAECPAADTQAALAAVRHALNCARRLRRAGEQEHVALLEQCAQATKNQMMALQQWGQGRGLNWDSDWGTQWGETLAAENSQTPAPPDSVIRL